MDSSDSSPSPLVGTKSRLLSGGVKLASCLRRSGLTLTVRKAMDAIRYKIRSKNNSIQEPGAELLQALSPNELRKLSSVEVHKLEVSLQDLQKFSQDHAYPYYYYRNSRPSYMLWHYVGMELAQPAANELVVDVGAQAGIWSGLAQQSTGCRSYDLDLEFRPGIHGNRIGASADAIPLDDDSVASFVSFCAFNCFEGPADMGFLREASRCLKPGGKIVIVPICISTKHTNIYDPLVCDREESFDPGAERKAWHGWGNNFGRWYDSMALQERILAHLPGFQAQVFEIEHDIPGIPWPGAMYAARFTKPA